MTTNGQQDNQENQGSLDKIHQPGLVNPSRRRFGKSGLAVSGVLATLASRPVLGCEICQSPSKSLSGNLSPRGEPQICAGRSPGYWKNHSPWPIPNRSTVKFSSVFTCYNSKSPYAKITMLNLLTHQSFDNNNLGMHLVAAYLNVKKGWTPFLTVERLNSMFTELQKYGYFTPTAGVKWTAAQVVDYISKTQD